MDIQSFSPNAIANRLDPAYANSLDQVQRERSGSESAVSGNKGDTVSVSQDALLLNQAARTAQNTPDVRTEQVEALRIQVANGTYQPDSRLIAENLVREEPGLFM